MSTGGRRDWRTGPGSLPSLLSLSDGHSRPPPRLPENFHLREVAWLSPHGLTGEINDGLWCFRCNLRCQYCMPSEGVSLTPNTQLLSQDEIVKIAQIFVSEGVKKVSHLPWFLHLQYPPVNLSLDPTDWRRAPGQT